MTTPLECLGVSMRGGPKLRTQSGSSSVMGEGSGFGVQKVAETYLGECPPKEGEEVCVSVGEVAFGPRQVSSRVTGEDVLEWSELEESQEWIE